MKDYCGAMREDVVRKNATLVYELIDEAMDYVRIRANDVDGDASRENLWKSEGVAGLLVSLNGGLLAYSLEDATNTSRFKLLIIPMVVLIDVCGSKALPSTVVPGSHMYSDS